MFIEIGVNCIWSCQHWIRTAPRVWSDSWPTQTRNLRSTSSQRIFWGNIKKKMAFSGMITSLSCMTEKMTLKATWKIVNIMSERKVCRPHGSNSILCCPKVHWSLPSATALWSSSHLETHWISPHILVQN